MRFSTLLLPLVFISSAFACVNDRDSDSLANQAKKLPDTLRVITGRFERNPPLYYEMRIRRSLEQLKKNPRQFGLYDDIGAAYDRLHLSGQALQIMEKKRVLLPPFSAKSLSVKEAWYRYYANAGTFRAHRWLGAGAKVQSIGEMKQARDYIRRAIQIKPNAHFGREKYQLMTMEWIIATRERKGGSAGRLGDWIARRDKWGWGDENLDRKRAATEGLSGLVVLGAAWQSPDIFEALGAALENKDGITLRYLALLRSRELLQAGKASLAPEALNLTIADYLLKSSDYSESTGVAVNDKNQKTLEKMFPQWRTEADIWAGHRTAYMLAKLEKGKHPDTDTQFWNSWKPEAPPSVDVDWFNQKSNQFVNENQSSPIWPLAALLCFAGVVPIWGLRFITRCYRRDRGL